MRLTCIAAALVIACSLLAAPAGAQEPAPGVLDPRIRTVAYDPDQVVLLRGWFGYQMMIEFAPDERIENVSIGDALGWQVTPNRRANLLFLKPIDRTAVTNMTVVTDKRRYAFDLTVAAERARPAAMAYVVRFRYPQSGPVQVAIPPPPVVPPPTPPESWNFSYSFSGARDTQPSKVFDDGKATFFAWPAAAATPGIFAVGPDGAESVVNYSARGQYLVVDQIAPRFMLRNGKSVTVVVNEAFRQAGDPAPMSRPENRERRR